MSNQAIAVVGAGPAGTTAARLLAEQGARVTCYEARRFPREKPCGGGLTPKTLALVPADAERAALARIAQTEVHTANMRDYVATSPVAAITMVDRGEFDHILMRCAVRAGADIREGTRVRGVSEDEDGVTVVTRADEQRYDLLVVADGAPSTSARSLGLEAMSSRRSLALELDLPVSDDPSGDLARLSFDVPSGYAWYFPKGDHANVGVAARCSIHLPPRFATNLKEHLRSFARDLSLTVEDRRVRGHWIPQGLRAGRLSTRRVILVGDAAGTADPLLGEGISFAIISAMLAVGTIQDRDTGRIANLLPYDRRLRELLGPAFRRLTLAAAIAHRSPSLSLLAYRLSAWVRTYADDVIAGSRAPFLFEIDPPSRASAPERPTVRA